MNNTVTFYWFEEMSKKNGKVVNNMGGKKKKGC